MARQKRWERLLDQLREEFERMEDALDDAAELVAEQEREIVRLGEEVERLADELEARGDPARDDDDRRPRPIARVLEPVEDDAC